MPISSPQRRKGAKDAKKDKTRTCKGLSRFPLRPSAHLRLCGEKIFTGFTLQAHGHGIVARRCTASGTTPVSASVT